MLIVQRVRAFLLAWTANPSSSAHAIHRPSPLHLVDLNLPRLVLVNAPVDPEPGTSLRVMLRDLVPELLRRLLDQETHLPKIRGARGARSTLLFAGTCLHMFRSTIYHMEIR